MTNKEIRKVNKVNGKPAEILDLIGPFTAPNGAQYWLVQFAQDGKLFRRDTTEYWCFRSPLSNDWGWDLTGPTPGVHYSFAKAVEKLLMMEREMAKKVPAKKRP